MADTVQREKRVERKNERRTFDIEKKMIEDAVRLAIAEMPSLPICQIENAHIKQLDEALDKVTKLLTGNGDPKSGIIFRLAVIEASYNKPKDLTSSEKLLIFFVDKILPNLIVTGLLALIAFLFALNKHLIVMP